MVNLDKTSAKLIAEMLIRTQLKRWNTKRNMWASKDVLICLNEELYQKSQPTLFLSVI